MLLMISGCELSLMFCWWWDDQSCLGRGRGEHGGRWDDTNLRHSDALAVADVTIVRLVTTGCHTLVGVNRQRIDCFIH